MLPIEQSGARPQPDRNLTGHTGGNVRKITGLLALFAAATIFTVTSAQAVVVVDFESLETTNNTVDYVGDSYSEDGFELTNLSPGVGIGAFGTLESRFTGSTALFEDNA